MIRRIGVNLPYYKLYLTQTLGDCCRVAKYKCQVASSLVVKPEIFRKRLGCKNFKSLFYEVPDTPSILISIPGSKSLICAIEEAEQISFPAYFSNFFPLFHCWVHTGRIVSARMKYHNRIFFRVAQIFKHSVNFKSFSSWVPVSVFFNVAVSCLSEYSVVITPGWIRNVNICIRFPCVVVFFQKICSDAQCSGSRQTLYS